MTCTLADPPGGHTWKIRLVQLYGHKGITCVYNVRHTKMGPCWLRHEARRSCFTSHTKMRVCLVGMWGGELRWRHTDQCDSLCHVWGVLGINEEMESKMKPHINVSIISTATKSVFFSKGIAISQQTQWLLRMGYSPVNPFCLSRPMNVYFCHGCWCYNYRSYYYTTTIDTNSLLLLILIGL